MALVRGGDQLGWAVAEGEHWSKHGLLVYVWSASLTMVPWGSPTLLILKASSGRETTAE